VGPGSSPLLFEGSSGSRYSDGANGKNIHRQLLEACLLMFEAAAESGILEASKPGDRLPKNP
jgi:hypothetical protein